MRRRALDALAELGPADVLTWDRVDLATGAIDDKPTPAGAEPAGGFACRARFAARAEAAWTAAGLNRITLHECRHTYASLLMAAGYTIKELMEFMGHADLQMVNRYVKLLRQSGEGRRGRAIERLPRVGHRANR